MLILMGCKEDGECSKSIWNNMLHKSFEFRIPILLGLPTLSNDVDAHESPPQKQLFTACPSLCPTNETPSSLCIYTNRF
jgi:hypothetical protein